MSSEIYTNSPEETVAFGRAAAERLGAGRILCLEADLGGGKTVLTKGLACGFGVSDMDTVTSPTFTLVNRYEGENGNKVYHIDLYRLHSASEALDIGIDEILGSGETVIIEWPERIGDLLSGLDVVNIHIEVCGEFRRLIRISG